MPHCIEMWMGGHTHNSLRRVSVILYHRYSFEVESLFESEPHFFLFFFLTYAPAILYAHPTQH